MPSINSVPGEQAATPAWRAVGLRYHTYRFFLSQRFGKRVRHVSINAGMTCPNVDGTVARGGCVFCDNRSFSPSRRVPRAAIAAQIDEGIRRIRIRYRADGFLAYFQPATNTYAPADELRPLFETALAHPEVVGLVIGTRPDCVPDDVLALVTELAARHYVAVEYGLQSMHDRSLDWMNRGHHFDAFVDAVERSRGRGFEIGTHVILGLPGESSEDMQATARAIAELDLDSVKLHNLYAVEHTPLADWVRSGEVRLLERDEYVTAAADFLELLPERMVIERVTGEAPPEYLVGPAWSLDKPATLKALEAELVRRDSWQGKKHG
jgi:uncharacterized protein